MSSATEVPAPPTRPRALAALLVPLPLAAAAGLATGLSPHQTLLAAAAAVSALVLGARLEWAALAVVAGSVSSGYLALLSPHATTWLGAVLVAAWLVRRAGGRLHAHRLRRAALPAVLVLAAVALAALVHPRGWPGAHAVAAYAGTVAVFLVLADCLCGPLAPRRAARWYVGCALVAAACGLVTAAVSDRHRVVGPVAGADDLAFVLLAALPLVGTVRSREDQPEWWVWAAAGLLVAAGVGTQSRPAFVALVVLVVVATATGLLALRHAGALLAVVATGVALVVSLLPLPLGQALTDPQRYADSTVATRLQLREAAWELTLESPVVGQGPAAFRLLHADHRPEEPSARTLDTAYSTALEASAELGVLGLLALYAAWLVPLVTLVRRRRDRFAREVALALGGLLVASLLLSQQTALPLWLLAALALALGRPRPHPGPLFAPPPGRRTSGQVASGSPIPRPERGSAGETAGGGGASVRTARGAAAWGTWCRSHTGRHTTAADQGGLAPVV